MGTSRFEVLPMKFLMHFKDGATSYLRLIQSLDGFYTLPDDNHGLTERVGRQPNFRSQKVFLPHQIRTRVLASPVALSDAPPGLPY